MEQLTSPKRNSLPKQGEDGHTPKHEDKTTLTYHIPEAERLIRSVTFTISPQIKAFLISL